MRYPEPEAIDGADGGKGIFGAKNARGEAKDNAIFGALRRAEGPESLRPGTASINSAIDEEPEIARARKGRRSSGHFSPFP